ncbi:MAG: efflux RND transporter periplasmic adaptor subunit [Acidobacteria bacterium]|nr:efflux RND transporter periplasmic adaptor subunit [Acidobacteriota bacterium]
MTKNRFLSRTGVAVAICATLLSMSCSKKDPATEAAIVPEVTVTVVHKAPLNDSLRVSGNLSALPNRDAKVSAVVPGRIAEVLVAEGAQVQANQELAKLDNPSLHDQMRQAEAAVAQAKANVENARVSAERVAGLFERGIAARKEIEDARTLLAVNESLLKNAEAALSAAQTQVARSVLRAPFAGTVVHRFLGVGEQVDGTSNQPVVEVAQIDPLELLGTVPGSRLSTIKANVDLSFQTPEVPGVTFQAKVADVLPAVDPATGNGTVRIRIKNSRNLLKLGMFISIDLPVSESAHVLVIPRQAVYPDEAGEPHVYKVSGEDAAFVPVKVGTQTKDQVQILDGIQEGETIILAGGYGLPEKAKVRVKP